MAKKRLCSKQSLHQHQFPVLGMKIALIYKGPCYNGGTTLNTRSFEDWKYIYKFIE